MSEFIAADPEQSGGKRILIVEDDAIVAKVYQRRLTKAGFRVSVVHEGNEGFFAIIKDKPDGVLLDLMLPQMDGLEILRKTRAQKQFERTPIIVFSNAFMNGMLQDAAASGATMTVNKSEPNAIESIVEAFLQHLCRFPTAQTVKVPAPAAPTPAQEIVEPAPPQQTKILLNRSTQMQASITPPAAAFGEKGRRFGVFPIARNRVTQASAPAPSAGRAVNRLARGNFGSVVRNASAWPEPIDLEAAEEDRSAQLEILNAFFSGGDETIAAVRNALRDYQKEPSTPRGRQCLETFYKHIHRLSGISAMCSSESISNFSASIEALAHELLVKPDSFRPSTLKTLATAVDVLSRMFKENGRYECSIMSPAVVLVVDDDVVSQRAVTLSLEKARLQAMCATDMASALDQIREVLFELIFLEAAMPAVDGFELCSKIREIPGYERTPIVFVTGMNDFQSRVRSVAMGASDFISKPLCRIEMTVKALTYVMRGRLAGAMMNTPQVAS